MTPGTALAFVEVLVKSPKVAAHLGAVLGHKGVPTVEDFEDTNAEAFDRVDFFIDYLRTVAGTLEALHKDRPRQQEVDLGNGDGDPWDAKRKKAPAKQG
jgi:hypothetical protein